MRYLAARITFLGLVLLATGGCSLVFVNGPPLGHQRMEDFSCTESRVWPIVDIGLGATAAATTRVQTESPVTGEWEVVVGQTIAFAAAVTAVYALSSFVGFKRVSTCRAAKQNIAQREKQAVVQTARSRSRPDSASSR